MKQVVGLSGLASIDGPTAVTIGTFDGVHRGHRYLIGQTISEARARGVEAMVVTWDRHPSETLRPDRVPPLLTTSARKLELLAGAGADVVAVLPFDRELSQWPPERFAEVLARAARAQVVVVGSNWRFGHKAAGNVSLLAKLGADLGFDVDGIDLEQTDGGTISSSRVRAAITSGELTTARSLLGRPHDLDGEVVHGDDRGRGLGFPTANVELDPALACPPRGVYAGRARVPVGRSSVWRSAAINIGVNPTFGGDPATTAPRLEAYILDFEADLYGEVIRVELWERLRDEQRFDSADALVAQIAADVEATRRLVSG